MPKKLKIIINVNTMLRLANRSCRTFMGGERMPLVRASHMQALSVCLNQRSGCVVSPKLLFTRSKVCYQSQIVDPNNKPPLKRGIVQYGVIGTFTYVLVSLTCFWSLFFIFKTFIDPERYPKLEKLMNSVSSKVQFSNPRTTSAFLGALVVNKLLTPVQMLAIIPLARFLCRSPYFRRGNLGSPLAPS